MTRLGFVVECDAVATAVHATQMNDQAWKIEGKLTKKIYRQTEIYYLKQNSFIIIELNLKFFVFFLLKI